MEKNKKVFIIDDEANIRQVLESKLKGRRFQVLSATNGEEGLAIIEPQQPDVVTTDLMMCKLAGEALCKKATKLKQEKPFLTIVITGRINPEDRDWFAQMQDTLFMEESFSPARI